MHRKANLKLASSRITGIVGSLVLTVLFGASGCWAPIRTEAIPACTLPDDYRIPFRSISPRLNFSRLTAIPPKDYRLGPDDVLEVVIPDLYEGALVEPIRTRVMSSGEIQLPLVAPINVNGMNLIEAQREITIIYDKILKTPRVSVSLLEKAMVNIVVLGEVNAPGIVTLPKYQNDVGHALAAAGGLAHDAAELIEVHRRPAGPAHFPNQISGHHSGILPPPEICKFNPDDAQAILRIPLRGEPTQQFSQQDIILHAGDVIVVPSRSNEVFFVVGQLDDSNLVRFSLGDRERELGTGLILPRDRDIDVVTAVAMAGYIDPIESPTTVSVHRVLPDGKPMMIKVDLIKARYDRKETIMVRAGDIIYVNPDASWWFRRTFDRIIVDLLISPYDALFRNAVFR